MLLQLFLLLYKIRVCGVIAKTARGGQQLLLVLGTQFQLRYQAVGALGFLLSFVRKDEKNSRDDQRQAQKRTHTEFQYAFQGEGIACHFLRDREGLKRGLGYLIALLCITDPAFEFTERMLFAKLCADACQQFVAVSGKWQDIVEALVQPQCPLGRIAGCQKDHAGPAACGQGLQRSKKTAQGQFRDAVGHDDQWLQFPPRESAIARSQRSPPR